MMKDRRERPVAFVVTCEHGGNRIPREYAPLFRGHRRLLQSHRGYDPGALATARELARALGAVLVTSTVSRLLVELNRSPNHRRIYSTVMREAEPEIRADVYRRFYQPYRTRVEAAVRAAVKRGRRVVHVSSHSFTPVLNGVVRDADVAFLYDPARAPERRLCREWQRALQALARRWRVRRNYPYRGSSDGLTRYLRERFTPAEYVGIELEINQKHLRGADRAAGALRANVLAALRAAVAAGL
jgi:predicted N-formylglutamate amidohydrolase